ncbi:hypothetical protein [Sphingomonas sp.]|uniref:hypothetical protein n=1 Tax=Sphingomonas sp. TaxID=28214 RepID=UPI0025E2E675|nr:hypothetical protein [Sphingomonas sp.]
MNALIPAFVAVLLAEIGGGLIIFGRERRLVAAFIMLLLIVLAVITGSMIGALLIVPARTLMLGLALVFAATAQFGRGRSGGDTSTLLASALTLYRSPSPFLAFAFTAWMGAPIGAGAGSMAALVVAAGIGTVAPSMPRGARVGAGTILGLAGIFAMLSGLRVL